MEDERRKFLRGLLALGGGAAMLPELAAAMQSTKLKGPLSAKILKHESTKNDPFLDTEMEVEITGANSKRTISVTGTEYSDTVMRRNWATIASDNDASVIAIKTTARKVDSGHEEITVTVTASGKTNTNTRIMAIPANRVSSEGMTDEELVEKFLAPKLGGVK
jgi:hypothetical protein